MCFPAEHLTTLYIHTYKTRVRRELRDSSYTWIFHALLNERWVLLVYLVVCVPQSQLRQRACLLAGRQVGRQSGGQVGSCQIEIDKGSLKT